MMLDSPTKINYALTFICNVLVPLSCSQFLRLISQGRNNIFSLSTPLAYGTNQHNQFPCLTPSAVMLSAQRRAHDARDNM